MQSNLIKPALSSGQLRCIGATTYQEYRGVFEKDRALARRFQKVDVPEPTVSETAGILKGLRSKFEHHHGVAYQDGVLPLIAKLAGRYMNDRHMPDKAIDVMDEAAAMVRIRGGDEPSALVTSRDVETVIARMAKIPESTVSASDKSTLRTLEKHLKMVVFGQDGAVERLVSAVKLSRSGLSSPNKPIGSFLFTGPTGVGKTEVCKQLSLHMGLDLIRFDMSEYMESHSVARLIGAPPGYVGYDKGGLLTEAVNSKPYSILLLDEIEKAHPDICNLLLQVMDNGSLTDTDGRKVDFRNVLLVMTSNVGAAAISRNSMGFIEQDNSSDGQDAVKKLFTPEFRNRLDAVIPFSALGQRDDGVCRRQVLGGVANSVG